jgi:hypothetical protein
MGRIGNFRFLALMGAVLFLAGSLTPARAQDPDDLKRGVARISLINGDVSVRRGDSGDWVAGVINAPLLTDDYVASGPNSRAEIQFDANNLLRVGGNAELRLTQLEYGRNQMELAHGVMTYRMLRPSDGNIEVDTPSLSVRPQHPGSFRVSVNDAGETEVTARNGDVEVFTPRGSQWVRNGQTLMARGASGDAEFQVVAAGAPDEWDRWSDSRDRAMMQSISARNVGPGVYGTEDMDASGSWTSVPEYGNVWHPNVGPDWAPYQSGRWVWEDWYGWTWVSYDPWGWAPYHYGRWFFSNRIGWCWYPGLIGARHYWSPALVGFFGFGGGGGIGFGFGNVGWVPLAPFEVFHPWWGRGFYGSAGFNRSINITNVNITNVYRNAQFRNGISAVAARDFQSGRFNNVIRTSGVQVGSAGVIRGQMPFTAGAQNLRFSDRQATAIPRATQNTRFFSHQQPNPVQRGQMNPAVRQTTQRAVSPGNRVGGSQNSDAGGWRRFGSPSAQPAGGQSNQPSVNRNGSIGTAQAQRNDRPSSNPQGGWQRFGAPAGGNTPSQSPAPARQNFGSSPNQAQRFGAAGGSGSLRIAPPVVRERPSSAPRQSAPSYNSAPRQSTPTPRNSGGGSSSHGSSGNSHSSGHNR